MATDTVQAPNQLAAIQSLLNLVSGGGQTVTRNPGDIAALQQVLAQLQGTDHQALLASIFQQAAGAIPGFQQAYSNAAGARSGNNSAMTAALEKLLKVTALEGQKQVADQTLRNQQAQVQAGQAIAQATGNTRETARPNSKTGSQLGDLAALIGLLKGAQALTGSNSVQDMFGRITGGVIGTASAPATSASSGGGFGMSTPVNSPQVRLNANAMPSSGISSAAMPAWNPSALSNQFSLSQPNTPAPSFNAMPAQQFTTPANQYSLVQPGAPAPQFNAMPIQQATTPIDQFSLVQPGMATPTFNANWW